MADKKYKVGKWNYDPATGHFVNGSEELFLELRLNKLLSILLANQGEVVQKDEIMNYVWKETIVTEDNLSRAIADLRKFLKSHQGHEMSVETIRSLGYRLTLIQKKQKKSVGRLVLRVFLIVVAVFLFAIMLIRAIHY